MFRRGGKLSILSTKDDKIKVIHDRINMTERHLIELCSNFASCSRKLAKYRNSYDELARGLKSYADEEDINEGLCEGLKSFTNSITVLADFMDIEVHRMELKIINELSQFDNICKATRENLRIAVIARDKEVVRQKQMMDIKTRFSANTSAADSELMKAKLEVNRANKDIDEIVANFEKRKLHDLKQLLLNFVLISMKHHTKSLEALSATYYDISNMDEKNDLKEFQKLMKFSEDTSKKSQSKKALRASQSMDSLDTDEGTSSERILSKSRLTRSTKDLAAEIHTEDEVDEESDESAEEEEETNGDTEESGTLEEDESEESDSETPKQIPPKVQQRPSSIGIPRASPPATAFGRMVTVAETKGDPPTATPRQPIDCSSKRK